MTAAGTYYGEDYDASVTVPPTLTHASKHGKITSIISRCITATNLGVGTVIKMYKPPKGSRLISGNIWTEAHATGLTLAVGTSLQTYDRATDIRNVDYDDKAGAEAITADTFLAATSGATAMKTDLLPVAKYDRIGYEFDGDTWIQATSAGAELVTGKYIGWQLNLLMP
jgi:hypothetical protein